MRGWVKTLMVAGSMMAAGAASAGSCGYDYCWGAVGIGPNGQWGWSASFSSEGGAISKVRRECPGCNQIETFYNTCGAMAVGSNGAWGFGWAGSRGGAEGNAIAYCSDYGSGCHPVVWACSQ